MDEILQRKIQEIIQRTSFFDVSDPVFHGVSVFLPQRLRGDDRELLIGLDKYYWKKPSGAFEIFNELIADEIKKSAGVSARVPIFACKADGQIGVASFKKYEYTLENAVDKENSITSLSQVGIRFSDEIVLRAWMNDQDFLSGKYSSLVVNDHAYPTDAYFIDNSHNLFGVNADYTDSNHPQNPFNFTVHNAYLGYATVNTPEEFNVMLRWVENLSDHEIYKLVSRVFRRARIYFLDQIFQTFSGLTKEKVKQYELNTIKALIYRKKKLRNWLFKTFTRN